MDPRAFGLYSEAAGLLPGAAGGRRRGRIPACGGTKPEPRNTAAADGAPGGLRGVIEKDPSLTPLRRLVAAEMLVERIRDLNHDVDEAFAKLTKDQTDKAAVQAAAQAADLPPRVKDRVIAKAKEWTYTPSETEAPAKARPVDSK